MMLPEMQLTPDLLEGAEARWRERIARAGIDWPGGHFHDVAILLLALQEARRSIEDASVLLKGVLPHED